MPDSAPPHGTLLAFDYGLKRIGVAVGQTQTCTASALETVEARGAGGLQRIDSLIEEWRPCALVVGLPLAPDGSESDMSRAARNFAETLVERTGLPLFFQDERLTSRAAEAAFAGLRAAGERRRRDAAIKDAMAAKIILENWLQSHPVN